MISYAIRYFVVGCCFLAYSCGIYYLAYSNGYEVGKSHQKIVTVEKEVEKIVEKIKYVEKERKKIYSTPPADKSVLIKRMRNGEL